MHTHMVCRKRTASVSLQIQESLFQDYGSPADSYDEAFTAAGLPRAHWQGVLHGLDALGSAELERRWGQARQMMYEHGVTFNPYSDAQHLDHPWELDAVPFVLAAAEWGALEAALLQRARLLNAVLADVYGPQTLLHTGVLPPELLFAHPGFLRPCYQVDVPGACYLHLYAADLARSPDGQWCVLADYAQNPVGMGYALENRLILSRTFADVLRDVPVQRLTTFFEAVRQTLCTLAPRHRDNPRIVLLTPGPGDATYFEHVYLARYLGYTLVQDGDLTVREQSVWLKTLAGLQPVDVILRRQADTLCDPLTLLQDTTYGVAGLVEAVRAGTVAVANALGSGWLDTPALLPLLPAFCQQLLGETLQLPSQDTWWCGQPEALQHVLTHLEHMVLRPIGSNDPGQAALPAQMSLMARRRLLVKLRARPYNYVAQTTHALSTVPVWSAEGLTPGWAVLRAYVAATADGYTVLPGGLTHMRPAPTSPLLGHADIEQRKDTWVLAACAATTPNPLTTTNQPVVIRRSGYDLPSRVADNLLWLGRYAERVEGAVRLLRSMLRRLTDESGLTGNLALPTMLQVLYAWWHLVPTAALTPGACDQKALERTLLTVMFDPRFPDSVRANLSALHRAATTVRDRISIDAWRILVRLDQEFTLAQPYSLIPVSDALGRLNQALITLAAFSGLGVENMTRGPGWHFLDMGRRLERTVHTLTLLQQTLVESGAHEAAVLDIVLEIADSSMTYRSRYLTTLQFAPVLDLLLTDDTNPRSILYQLRALDQHVTHLPRDDARPTLSQAQRLALSALHAVQLAELQTLCAVNDEGQRAALADLLARLLDDVPALAETITHQYLSHAVPARHLALHRRLQAIL
jgi:uncharacterized circularly permuted ATP-grasp superfamily protein/uncharacterized alpha-E superfamily protein